MTLREEIVSLTGAPGDVGRAFGQVTGQAIRRDVASFLQTVDESELAAGELERRVDRYQAIVGRVAPHWHEEMAAIALAAGVSERDYTAHVAQKYVIRSLPVAELPHECTSFMAVGTATADGRSILHKNRDAPHRAQGVCIRAVEGTHRYLASGDASDHGVTHFVNEHGLSGAMNAGSPNEDVANEGLPTPQILRLIAERAATCEDALAILQEVVGEGWYTNGESGSVWLFVSPGRGLIVENTCHHIDHTWIEDDILARANDFFLPETLPFTRPDALTNTRYVTARRGAEQLRGRARSEHFRELSRDTSSEPQRICGDRTISGFTAVIDPDWPGLLSMGWVALGNPGSASYVPFFVGAEGVPGFVMDGTLWEQSARLQSTGWHPDVALEDDEGDMARDVASLQGEVKRLFETGGMDEGIERVTAASATWARRVASHLERAGAGGLQPT